MAKSIKIFRGSSGESVEISDAEVIKRITDNINSVELSREKRDNIDGFSYAISWYDENGAKIEAITVFYESKVSYDGWIYTVKNNGEIDIEYVDIFFADSVQ